MVSAQPMWFPEEFFAGHFATRWHLIEAGRTNGQRTKATTGRLDGMDSQRTDDDGTDNGTDGRTQDAETENGTDLTGRTDRGRTTTTGWTT